MWSMHNFDAISRYGPSDRFVRANVRNHNEKDKIMIDKSRAKLIVIDQLALEKYTTCTHRSLKVGCRVIEIENVTYTLHTRDSLRVNIRRLIFWQF